MDAVTMVGKIEMLSEDARRALATLIDQLYLTVAPEDEDGEPLTDYELQVLAESKKDIAAGRYCPVDEVFARLDAKHGLTE